MLEFMDGERLLEWRAPYSSESGSLWVVGGLTAEVGSSHYRST